jgi:hypothetical protein
VAATAAAGGRRAQSTVKSGDRKNERRGGGDGDSDGVGNKQQSNKNGSEKNGGFCNGGGDGDGVDNGDHDDSSIDDGDGNNGSMIIVNRLVKNIYNNQNYPTMGEEERLLSYATAAADNDKDDNARGGSPPWEGEEDHRFQ